MTALVKTAVGTIVMFALAILVTLMVGRFVFTQFGAVVIFGVATAMSLEREWLLWLLLWMLVVAAWRAWRVNAKGMSA